MRVGLSSTGKKKEEVSRRRDEREGRERVSSTDWRNEQTRW